MGDGVTNVNMCGVWPAAKAPGPAGVTPSTALSTDTQQHKGGCNQHCCLPATPGLRQSRVVVPRSQACNGSYACQVWRLPPFPDISCNRGLLSARQAWHYTGTRSPKETTRWTAHAFVATSGVPGATPLHVEPTPSNLCIPGRCSRRG